MKHKGALMEYTEQRIAHIMQCYDDYLHSTPFISLSEACNFIAAQPTPRFFVSDFRAAAVVSQMVRGRQPTATMTPHKAAMFSEIYRRVIALGSTAPHLSIAARCAVVVEQPAPSLYISPGYVKILITKYRKQWLKSKLKRLYRSS